MARSADVRPLPADLQKVAVEELFEVPERKSADIEALKTWIQQQPHLKARTDDQFLLAFLRGCKYSLEKAKSKIDRFYTLRTKFPDFLGIRDFNLERTLELFRHGVVLHLPTPLYDNGPRITLLRAGFADANKFSLSEFVRLMQIVQDIAMFEDDYIVINGVVSISDMQGVGAAHFVQMTPTVMKRMVVWAEEALPLRQKANHSVNLPPGFASMFNIFKVMMPKKQQDRLYMHSNFDSLHEQIPKKYLPKEYGGENGTLRDVIDDWEKRIIAYHKYFEEESNYGTNENLRLGKPIDFESIFGIEGSFRKLDVD